MHKLLFHPVEYHHHYLLPLLILMTQSRAHILEEPSRQQLSNCFRIVCSIERRIPWNMSFSVLYKNCIIISKAFCLTCCVFLRLFGNIFHAYHLKDGHIRFFFKSVWPTRALIFWKGHAYGYFLRQNPARIGSFRLGPFRVDSFP